MAQGQSGVAPGRPNFTDERSSAGSVIHKRGPEGPNLALVVIKCEWNTRPREEDAGVARSIKEKQGYQARFLLEIAQAGFQLCEV